jgi:hypothetical protein
MNLFGMKIYLDGWLMSKWVNIYVILIFSILVFIFVNISLSFFLSLFLMINSFYIIYLSKKYKTTSFIHVLMSILSITIFFLLGLKVFL